MEFQIRHGRYNFFFSNADMQSQFAGDHALQTNVSAHPAVHLNLTAQLQRGTPQGPALRAFGPRGDTSSLLLAYPTY